MRLYEEAILYLLRTQYQIASQGLAMTRFLIFNRQLKIMNKLFFAFAALFLSVATFAQIATADQVKGKAGEYYTRADYDYQYGKFNAADSFAHMAVKEKDNFIDAWILIGKINSEALKNYTESARAYEKAKALKADYDPSVTFNLGLCYMNLADYTKAKSNFTQFLAIPKIPAEQRLMSEQMIKDCDFAVDAMKHPVDFKPVNLGPGVNTADDESMPSLTIDGKYLYFTRHYGSGNMQDEDIYMSLHTAAGWQQATSIGDAINTEQYVEGAQNISPSGKYLFFTSAERPDGLGRADIYMARKVGDQWERANNIGAPINTPGYETQPCISADGKQLYYAGIRADGYGGTDIWVSNLNPDGTWGKPQNLGPNVNTEYDEMRPFIHPDGQTLYFSSRGHEGMGNFDIFMSRKQPDGSWGKAVNLGYPINTAGDELGIFVTADGTMAYYASERKGGKGQMDIYSFELPEQFRPHFSSYVKGMVYDKDSKAAIQANVQVYDLETGKLYGTLSGDKVNGVFLSALPAGKNYAVEVLKDGYLFHSQNVMLKDAKEGTPVDIDIALQKIKVGESVVLNNVFFESDKYELKPESASELSVVMKLLEKNPSMKIEIGGHTDNTGTEEQNKKLSENRAKSVYDYLVKNGVAPERLSYKGYAATKPIADNNTPEGKAKNRRTEFIVTGL
jgi:outer membrane protein OmpA-like peptidoglycan-associated protein/tetratricopeptide (TPR) repeat protein